MYYIIIETMYGKSYWCDKYGKFGAKVIATAYRDTDRAFPNVAYLRYHRSMPRWELV